MANAWSNVNYFSGVFKLVCRSWRVVRGHIKVLRAKVHSLCKPSLLSDGGLLRALTAHIFVRVRSLALVFTSKIREANRRISNPERCWDNFRLLLGWLNANSAKLRLNRGLEVCLGILKGEDLSLHLCVLSGYVKYFLPQAFNDKVAALKGGLDHALDLLDFGEEPILVTLHLLLKSQQARVCGSDSVVKTAMAARE